ncbi:eCIS core domain-containing protein [Leptothoe spongobia]|uniref:DUF4157 domain-containing protein n=1 Tax=Leptothoe spongobia TAU-MAC 1115 TaxID=1967444 RepID=A0A947GKP6_9CYAN|nr:DUF4157 domain-containing protein [Leptothoe spongobia]MBT9316647.1 DUF4157 domain-containing protein [Leptothoe spongobia TAU-MAC 1115]
MSNHSSAPTKAPAAASSFAPNTMAQARPFVVQQKSEEQKPGTGFEQSARLDTNLLQNLGIQTKLTIGQPDDRYEQEADHVAAQVVERINTPQVQQSSIQRQPLPIATDSLQMMSHIPPGVSNHSPGNLESSIESARGQGQPLGSDVRGSMEQAFGTDFGSIRIHNDAQSDQLNQSIQAKAFTTGQDIFFRQGAYQPKSPDGQELLAHELTHTIQQTGTTQRQLIQRAIDPSYPVTHGKFDVTTTTGGSNLPITISFDPAVTAPYSNQIGLIQIVKLTDTNGNNIEPISLPTARGASLRTTDNAAAGVEGGYFTDVLHNDAPATGGAGTNAPADSALPPQYPFGNDAAQPNPATPGLSRPNSGGGRGATVGYKRSNDPADIKAAELTDAPGYPTVNPANTDLDFEFETVAKGEDTMTTFGALKWSFGIRAGVVTNEQASVEDSQSDTFDAALELHRDFYVHEPVIFYFGFDSDQLNGTETAKIDTFLEYLRRFPDVKVTATGSADMRGGASQYNLDLSLSRAEAVTDALRDKGVPESQIEGITIGQGATTDYTPDATTDQDSEANRRGNRRVVLTFEHVPASGAGAGSGTGAGSGAGAGGTP